MRPAFRPHAMPAAVPEIRNCCYNECQCRGLNTILPCAGNFDTYVQTRADREQEQMKRYQWEQDQIAHMKVASILQSAA